MTYLELTPSQIFAIPLCTVIVWTALKRLFEKRPFAKLPGPAGGSFLLGRRLIL
jgi:hypothetical protein